MKNGTLPLCNLEQAKKLKALGFNLDTSQHAFFYKEDGVLERSTMIAHAAEYKPYPAPTVALALKWLRDNFTYAGLGIRIWQDLSEEWKFCDGTSSFYHTFDVYEDAESALLDCLLNYLEK